MLNYRRVLFNNILLEITTKMLTLWRFNKGRRQPAAPSTRFLFSKSSLGVANMQHAVVRHKSEWQATSSNASCALNPTLLHSYTAHSTLRTLHFTLHTPHFTLYTPTVLYPPHSSHSILCPSCSPHSTLYTTLSALHTVHSTPCEALHFPLLRYVLSF